MDQYFLQILFLKQKVFRLLSLGRWPLLAGKLAGLKRRATRMQLDDADAWLESDRAG
jgi:hypothetical protein